MIHLALHLSNEEDDILRITKLIFRLKSKEDALKYIIKNFGDKTDIVKTVQSLKIEKKEL